MSCSSLVDPFAIPAALFLLGQIRMQSGSVRCRLTFSSKAQRELARATNSYVRALCFAESPEVLKLADFAVRQAIAVQVSSSIMNRVETFRAGDCAQDSRRFSSPNPA